MDCVVFLFGEICVELRHYHQSNPSFPCCALRSFSEGWEKGNPEFTPLTLDSRFRGNDGKGGMTKQKNNMKKNLLIVLEGGDGSGKATQSKLLLEYLKKLNHVSYFDFPQYGQNVFGTLTGRCLKGDFGDFLHMSPYLSSLPYILDRACAKDNIISRLKRGHVVCNRYTPSNVGFQSAKISNKKEREELIQFLEQGEYEEIGLPRPDVVLYLDVPRDVASALVLKKDERAYLGVKKAKDQHEKDLTFQEKVSEVYKILTKKRKGWHIVSCAKNGHILPVATIHNKIISILKQYTS
jgi:dTMP kinase